MLRPMRVLPWAALLVGCGAPAVAPAPPPAPAAPAAKRPHVVQPFELVLRGAPESGVRRGILGRHGAAWLREDGEAHESPGWHDVDGAELAIAEIAGDRVRVLHEMDDVRMLVWIARHDLAPVVVREVGLAVAPDAPAAARGWPGVIVGPGAPIVERRRVDDVLEVAISTDGVEVAGFVAASAIGDFWDATPAAPRRPTHALDAGVTIRLAPDDAAPALATTTEAIEVRALAPSRGGWREIETLGARVTVHGFVRELDTDEPGSFGLVRGGHGYGSSHAITLDVPAGTCLYDAPDGEVIGIVVEGRPRLARHGADLGWFSLLVNSPWGLLDVPIRGEAGPDGDVELERCAELGR